MDTNLLVFRRSGFQMHRFWVKMQKSTFVLEKKKKMVLSVVFLSNFSAGDNKLVYSTLKNTKHL